MLFLESSYSIIALIFILSSFFAKIFKNYCKIMDKSCQNRKNGGRQSETRTRRKLSDRRPSALCDIYQGSVTVEIQTQLTAELLIPHFDLSDRLVISCKTIQCILIFNI